MFGQGTGVHSRFQPKNIHSRTVGETKQQLVVVVSLIEQNLITSNNYYDVEINTLYIIATGYEVERGNEKQKGRLDTEVADILCVHAQMERIIVVNKES